MKTYGEAEIQLHAFLTLALDENSGQIHAPVALPPGKDPTVPTEEKTGTLCSKSQVTILTEL
jgi:hypothetical protein